MKPADTINPATASRLEASPSAAKIALVGVEKTYQAQEQCVPALGPIDLEVQDGQFVVLVGPSGCGKSTLLNLVAGFDTPTAGSVTMEGRPICGAGPERMMMFQEPALFPWLSVLDNVMYGLRQRPDLSPADRREVARHYLEMVHMHGFEDLWTHQLSGGMKQRVALARALAPSPRVLLIDEPFGSLDALTRERLYAHIQEIHAATRKTVLFITHNVREAACLGDRVIVMTSRPGRIKCEMAVNLPRPRDFYDARVSSLAATILGELRSELSGAQENP